MSTSRIEQIDDIQKIQSFLIIISSPAKQAENEPPNQKDKILPRDLFEEVEEGQKKEVGNRTLQDLSKNGAVFMADQALRKINYKTRLNQKVQRHAQMKEKCEILINLSPLKIRYASTGCLRNASPSQKSHLKLSDFEKITRKGYNESERVPFEHRSFANLPQLKINPYELLLKCNNVLQKFYLFKTLKYTDKYCLYLAQNEKNRTIYTLKIIKKHELRKEQLEKLIKELKIQSYLNHVNLVKLLHITHDNNFLYVFYEPSMMTHHNLAEQIKDGGPLFERQVRRIIKQIGSAVDYLQKNNLIHQNIRPQSIYCQEGIVKLGNFSKAEHISPTSPCKSRSQSNLKWPISGSIFKDSKVDIWNIGFLTYELLFGKPLIVLQQGLSQDKISRESLYFSEEVDVSNMAKQFISACLERNLAKRLGIKEVMEHGFLKGGDKYRWTTA